MKLEKSFNLVCSECGYTETLTVSLENVKKIEITADDIQCPNCAEVLSSMLISIGGKNDHPRGKRKIP